MKDQILSSGDRILLSIKMSKIYDRLIREEDIDKITFRADLFDLKDHVETILEKYKEQYKDKY